MAASVTGVSWARLVGEVCDVLVGEVCDVHGSDYDTQAILERCDSLAVLLNRVMDSSPGPETVAALDRAIHSSARQLSALGTRLAATVRQDGAAAAFPAYQHLIPACLIAEHLVRVALKFRLRGAAQALFSCVSLPLAGGRALMGHFDALHGSSNQTFALLSQARLLMLLLTKAQDWGFDAQLAPASPVVLWLASAVSQFLDLHGTALGRGPPLKIQYCLAVIADTLTSAPMFSHHAATMSMLGSVQRGLVQVLVPLLHATAVAMQLPADRRPHECSWDGVYAALSPLTGVLAASVQEQLSATSEGDSSFAQRLVASTAQLFAAAPGSDTSDQFKEQLVCRLATLLGDASNAVSESILQQQQPQRRLSPAVSCAQRQHMLQPLLQAVAQLPAVLRLLMDFFQAQLAAGADLALGREWKAGMLKDCNNSVLLLSRLACLAPESAAHNSVAAATGAYSAASSLTEMVAWCTASSALLGALPHVAALEARSQLEHQAGAGQPSTAVARNLIHVSSNGTLAVLQFCCGMRSGGPWSASEVEAAYNALWQLHTTMCRSIHTSLQFESIQEAKMLGSLLNCVECVVHVRAAVQGQQLNPPAGPRHLLAMSLAQAEAVLATADAGPAALKDESMAALVLLKALEHGPPALASFAPVQQAMERLLARVEALGASGSADPAVLELSGMQEQSQRMQREPQPGDALELAQAAAIRSCAYLRCANLRCANLASEGGPAARQGAGSQRCSKCRVAWYCGTACSHADWRAGHRRVCRALGAARVAAREQQREGVEV